MSLLCNSIVTGKLDLIFAVSNFCIDALCKLYLNITDEICVWYIKSKKEKKEMKEIETLEVGHKGESFDKIHVIVF